MTSQYLSFVLPAYNEELNVLPLLKRITGAMKRISDDYEILFVVEGNDNTLNLLKKYKKEHSSVNLRHLYQKKALGLMGAFKKGFENVSKKTTHIVTMDVDLNHKPEELPRLIEKAMEGYNIVIGSRAVKNAKIKNVQMWKRILSKIVNFVFVVLFGIRTGDKTSGYRMIDIETIKEISPLVKSRGFEGLMEFLLIANRRKKTIAEVPITMIFRKYGESKLRFFRVSKGYLRLILKRNEIMRL